MQNVLSVFQFLELVNHALYTIPTKQFFVEGEVSDFRISQGKWVSFDLKDEEQEAVLKCFMTTWQMNQPLENGMRVHVQGYPKVYERFGTFKLNVFVAQPVGQGSLQRAYELLKQKLQAEGMFDLSRKRSLPRFPYRIGLITSSDAAAYGDFLRILNNRWSGVEVLFVHVHVQGRESTAEIVDAFKLLNSMAAPKQPDVIVLTRGGGGLEDLHAFNDESVARAVFGSTIPVVCAVGHERDESLCDFVADVRASTPSNAAERVVPNRSDVCSEIDALVRFQDDSLSQQIFLNRSRVERFFILMSTHLSRLFDALSAHERFLKSMDPARLLHNGYSLVYHRGKVLRNVSLIDKGESVAVQLAKGSFDATVTHIK